MTNIYKSLSQVMEYINKEGVAKNGTNMHQKYKYRAIDDLYPVLSRAFIAGRVILTQEVLSEGRTVAGKQMGVCVKMRYTFYAEDGSFVTSEALGYALDSSDKAYNKAKTAAYKYLMIHMFAIPFEGDTDADTTTPKIEDLSSKKMALQEYCGNIKTTVTDFIKEYNDNNDYPISTNLDKITLEDIYLLQSFAKKKRTEHKDR